MCTVISQRHSMRSLSSFMMWNHLAIAHSAYRCTREGYRGMGYLGYLTTILSLLYHRSNERHWKVPEGICAKASIALVVHHGLRAGLPKSKAVLPSAAVFILWRLSQTNYERWHPWMHLVVSADVYYFLHCMSSRYPTFTKTA